MRDAGGMVVPGGDALHDAGVGLSLVQQPCRD